MRTSQHFDPKALLAVIDAAATLLTIFAPPVLVQKERPLLLPLVAPAHKSRSGLRSF